MEHDARQTSFADKPPPPPEAPPLPPPPSTRREPLLSSNRLPSQSPDDTPSKSRANRAAMAAKFAAVERANSSRKEIPDTEVIFKPCHIFFYGSLMNTQVLQTVAKLENPPNTQRGVVKGFRIKMWGIYPAVVPDSGGYGVVAGTVWHIDNPSHLARLQEYETRAYKLGDCEIEVEGGHKLPGSKIFCWAGEADSPELEEGVFDFERYQKYFMPSIVSSGLQ